MFQTLPLTGKSSLCITHWSSRLTVKCAAESRAINMINYQYQSRHCRNEFESIHKRPRYMLVKAGVLFRVTKDPSKFPGVTDSKYLLLTSEL